MTNKNYVEGDWWVVSSNGDVTGFCGKQNNLDDGLLTYNDDNGVIKIINIRSSTIASATFKPVSIRTKSNE